MKIGDWAGAADIRLESGMAEDGQLSSSGVRWESPATLHPQRPAAKTPHEQTALDRQIAATDAQIDREVYALYGLSAEEIQLVEA